MSEHQWNRPDYLTDGEIKAELETATGERRAALEAERDERRTLRPTGNPIYRLAGNVRGVRPMVPPRGP